MYSRIAGVYAFLNLATGKVYVGSSVDMSFRCAKHVRQLQRGTHANHHLQAAWQQDAAQFAIGVLEHCDPSAVRTRERDWIQEMQAADREYGYNLNMACEERFVFAPETRAKISAGNRGKVRSTEFRENVSRGLTGRPVSAETRAKIGEANRNPSPEARARMSAARQGNTTWRGRTHTPETLAKMRTVKQGNSYNRGRTHTPEARANMSAAAKEREASKRAERAAPQAEFNFADD